MATGFRPRIISQIFAPTPAAGSRCISSFIAIARQSLPLTLRFGIRDLIAIGGLLLIPTGFLVSWITDVGSRVMPFGVLGLVLLLVSMAVEDQLTYGNKRAHLIRQLDESRRTIGLDRAILPESLEFLEASAQQWERIEHSLQTQDWKNREILRDRIYQAAHRAMEEILVLECGAAFETGMTDEQAEQKLTVTATQLTQLADLVDSASAAMMTPHRVEAPTGRMAQANLATDMERLEASLNLMSN